MRWLRCRHRRKILMISSKRHTLEGRSTLTRNGQTYTMLRKLRKSLSLRRSASLSIITRWTTKFKTLTAKWLSLRFKKMVRRSTLRILRSLKTSNGSLKLTQTSCKLLEIRTKETFFSSREINFWIQRWSKSQALISFKVWNPTNLMKNLKIIDHRCLKLRSSIYMMSHQRPMISPKLRTLSLEACHQGSGYWGSTSIIRAASFTILRICHFSRGSAWHSNWTTETLTSL